MSTNACLAPNAVIEPNLPPINLSYATILGLG
jgi:hypothetical protein